MDPKKHMSISILWGYPYVSASLGVYGISLSLFLLMCFPGALVWVVRSLALGFRDLRLRSSVLGVGLRWF